MQKGEDTPPRVGLQTTCPSSQLQGIGRYLNGYADGESDDSAECNGSGVDCGQGEVGGVEDHRAWRRAGKECTRAMALRELRHVQGRTGRQRKNWPSKTGGCTATDFQRCDGEICG